MSGRAAARLNPRKEHPMADSAEDWPPYLPNITPEFAELLELAAAERGLPPEPWPLPAE